MTVRQRCISCLVAAAFGVLALLAGCRPGRVLTIVTPSAQPLPTAVATSTPEATPTPSAAPIWRFLMPLMRQPAVPTAEPTPSPTPSPTKKPARTKTPKPTATPVLPWPEPLAQLPGSKLGLHIQWNNSSEIMEYIRRMKPRVVKAVGDYGFVPELKEYSPQTIVVARVEGQFGLDGDPADAARRYVAQHLATYQANPLVDYWEGPNEPGVNGRMDWYAAFEAERVRVMAGYGLKTAIGSFSTGVPEWEEFAAFLPAVREAKTHGGILTLHEYDAPTLDRTMGAGLPGHPSHADRGALAFRYRWWYEDFLKPQGLVIPLVISEVGVDGLVSNRPGPAKAKGWRNFWTYWRETGLGGDPVQVYLKQLGWYDAEIRKDDYVLGAAIFTAGAMNEDWASYDITKVLRHIATYLILPTAR